MTWDPLRRTKRVWIVLFAAGVAAAAVTAGSALLPWPSTAEAGVLAGGEGASDVTVEAEGAILAGPATVGYGSDGTGYVEFGSSAPPPASSRPRPFMLRSITRGTAHRRSTASGTSGTARAASRPRPGSRTIYQTRSPTSSTPAANCTAHMMPISLLAAGQDGRGQDRGCHQFVVGARRPHGRQLRLHLERRDEAQRQSIPQSALGALL